VARAMATARKLTGQGAREFATAVCEVLGRRSLHPSTVSKWEHGVVIPPADVLVAAALIADVPIEVLLLDMFPGTQAADRLERLEARMDDLSDRVAELLVAGGASRSGGPATP
jgi:transcriptional regulator with XRE-family HTH domain